MAKPIIQNPTIRGKAAKEFSKLFLSKTPITQEKQERNRNDVHLYHSIITNK
ncbi:MAG: hypothetical protein ACYDG5_06680 [Dehalococcoidales bacterium]